MRVGIDVVEIRRLASAIRKSARFMERTFTKEEIQAVEAFGEQRRSEFLAGRFAVKEAVLKALQTGIGELEWMKEIEVGTEPNGSPKLKLTGPVAAMAAEIGISDWQVSISHEAGLATALVVLS
jgi:holo-[acyl-carrier protein] synthase